MTGSRAVDINGGEDEDEALRIAIALSLGKEPEPPSSPRGRPGTDQVIDLTHDDDGHAGDSGKGSAGEGDDDVVILAHGDVGRSGPRQKDETATATASTAQQTTSVSVFSALGLDRRKMEEERLARLSKRKASSQVGDDGQPAARPAQRPRIADGEKGEVASLEGRKLTGHGSSSPSSRPDLPLNPSRSSASAGLPFPRGVVKKTWAYGQPRRGDDIKIEEVLQKQHLQLAVLSSYQWDEEWMLSKIDIARTKLILVAFAADEAQKEEMRSNVPRDRIRFCFPPMHGIGSMHSKLMLLKYENYLRIVVPTGNLMSFDWGETGTMENMVFILDLPKFETAEGREAQKLNRFADQLFYFLRAQGLDEKLVDSLRNYDFTEAGRYEFVHTIPGSHTGDDALRTGYCGLGQSVNALVGTRSEPVELDLVCASLGAVNYGLLTSLYYACLGDPLREYEERASGSQRNRDAFTSRAISLVKEHMRIFFPSRETVLRSKGGKDGAGTICLLSKWWQAPTFPRELVRDCKSVRPGVLMHTKALYVRPCSPTAQQSGRCFAYVGSANLSESAWGRLSRDRASGKPKLTCRNWECGVLLCTDRTVEGSSGAGSDNLGVFDGCLPVPMEWPGRAISEEGGEGMTAKDKDARTPWFYAEG
ncbi:tyrosyl-DNA phosphodiesterase-domain-containing protein [Thermothelomyces heterothallicus CBS 202.75]|uniref:tyrosyl-DNA phosphodiesterase-domain-containing protein n=1 Tax=Thermothelomyces heterothallicus CBS 202.75 TaxID=1149848 RepID=UPI003744AF56